jgi:hypothetical protein
LIASNAWRQPSRSRGSLSSPSSFASLLDCRKQQRNQDGNDRDNHKQFNQREAAMFQPVFTGRIEESPFDKET